LSTIAFGTGLLLLLRSARHARTAAIATGIAMLAITVTFGGNLLVWLVGLLVGGVLLFAGAKMRPRLLHFLMSFLAVQSLLNAFYHLRALLYLSAFDPSLPTDAANMSEATGGWIPPLVWAFGWSAISAVMVTGTLILYYRSLRRPPDSISTPTPALLPDPTFTSNPRA
jgi:hypothetical protein